MIKAQVGKLFNKVPDSNYFSLRVTQAPCHNIQLYQNNTKAADSMYTNMCASKISTQTMAQGQ